MLDQYTNVILGKTPTDEYVDSMISQMPDPLTFSSFLTVMSSIIGRVSPRNDLMDAFLAFEDTSLSHDDLLSKKENRITTDELKEMLLTSGMTENDIDTCFRPFLKSNGLSDKWFYYKDFVSMITSNGFEE